MKTTSVQPASTLESLSFLIGKWNSHGTTVTTLHEPSVTIEGTDTYEWVLDGKFILHTVDVHLDGEQMKVIELIGHDKEKGEFSLRSFDNQGNVTEMYAQLGQDGELQITGDNMQSTLWVNEDNSAMEAHWKKSEDNKHWLSWMDMKFTRQQDMP